MKPLIKALKIIVPLIMVYIMFTAINSCREHKQEVERLNGVISSMPQRSGESFVDSIMIPVYKDSVIVHHQIKVIKRYQSQSIEESSVSVTYADSIARALKVGVKEIERLTKINTKLKGELKKKDIILKNLKENEIKWKNKYIEISANTQDSTINYTYNADISIIDFSKKKHWYSKREHFTALTSSDPNFKINGVQKYEQKIDIKCPKTQLGFQGGYGLVLAGDNVKLAPYLGLGINFKIF